MMAAHAVARHRGPPGWDLVRLPAWPAAGFPAHGTPSTAEKTPLSITSECRMGRRSGPDLGNRPHGNFVPIRDSGHSIAYMSLLGRYRTFSLPPGRPVGRPAIWAHCPRPHTVGSWVTPNLDAPVPVPSRNRPSRLPARSLLSSSPPG